MGESIIAELLEEAHDPAAEALEAARATVEAAIAAAATDPTAHLTAETVAAFKEVRTADPIEYEIARTKLKRANRLIRMEALDSFTADSAESGKPESAATALADMAGGLCELWHDADGGAFASFEGGGGTHREHWKIESTGFREWLSWLAHTSLGAAPASETISATCNALAGKAKFDGEEFSPARRVARTDEGFWLDLCDDLWRAVLVTASGWKIIDRPPVRFVRTKAMRPLPDPARGGGVERLWPLVNVPEADRPLVLAWMLEAMRAGTPYPVLELIGEQGCAKSTTQETIRALIDPNKVMLRGRPKTVEDVFVAAGSNHVISLENLSGISAELSDALCTIATGGGQAGRQLFTNDEENIIEAHSPVMLNGIGAVVTRPDLLDRAIAICLPAIEARITEADHAEALEREAPAILGGLLDLFADALARLPEVSIDPKELPRMADFAHLGEAMHRAQGGAPGEWLALYEAHRADAVRRVVDSSPVAQACIEFVESGGRHAGTVKSLLEVLNARAGMGLVERGDYWPRSPRGLGDALRRVAPALRQIGIHAAIESKPRRDGIHCELRAAAVQSFPGGANIENQRSQRSPKFTPGGDREQVSL